MFLTKNCWRQFQLLRYEITIPWCRYHLTQLSLSLFDSLSFCLVCSDKWLMLEIFSAQNLFKLWSIYFINKGDRTKLYCNNPTTIAPQFLWNSTPLPTFICLSVCLFVCLKGEVSNKRNCGTASLGEYNRVICYYQLSWWRKLATGKSLKAVVLNTSPLSFTLTKH